jgi:hypothetical protein
MTETNPTLFDGFGEPSAAEPVDIAQPKPAPPRDETERLDPQPVELRLESGIEFDLEPLKLRQFLRLLRIVSRGAADVLDSTSLNFENPQEFVQTFLGMVLFSIPDAEDETIEFIKSMVKPKNLTGNKDKDLLKYQDLAAELDNPELEDTLTIVQAVVEREAEDIRALGKRLGAMFKVAQKIGAASPNSPSTQG